MGLLTEQQKQQLLHHHSQFAHHVDHDHDRDGYDHDHDALHLLQLEQLRCQELLQ
jgi:hypothetical protein